MRKSMLLPLVIGLCLLSAPSAQAAEQAGATETVTPAEAKLLLERLSKRLRSSKSTTTELEAAIQAVEEAYADVGVDAKARDAFRKKADALFLKAMLLWKTPRGRHATGNLRHETATRAGEALGAVAQHLDAKARRSLSDRVRRAIDGLLKQRDAAEIEQSQLDAAFAAVGKLNDPRALDWYAKQFMHTNVVEQRALLAAHKSLLLFKDVPGQQRYLIVKVITSRYASVEALAQQGNSVTERAAKRFWDEMKLCTVPALQHFAGRPTNAEDEALATVGAFREWLRKRKNPNRAPWKDA